MTERDFYEKLYAEHETTYGDGKPDLFVQKIIEYCPSGRALDLGAGDGRHSLFLAEHEFEVVAVDSAQSGLEKIQNVATAKGLRVNTETADITSFHIEGHLNAVVCTHVLHHLSDHGARSVIEKIKAATVVGGTNVITSFTKDGDFFRRDPKTDHFYLDADELRQIYQDWEILAYEEKSSRALAAGPDGKPQYNVTAKVLARKKI